MISHGLCCGCMACYNICPQKCINYQYDDEGFIYPNIEQEKCIHCGMCEKVCPAIHKKSSFKGNPFTWGGHAKNERVRRASSSGGLFTVIAEWVLNKGGCVFGAAFTSNYHKVKHIMVENTDDLMKIRGSKYLQSEIGNCFQQVRKQLEVGRIVLFSGTFCQIDGLCLYLGREYDNLITVELICHGVPSPLVFDKYIKEKEVCLGGTIRQVVFRDEQGGWLLKMRIESKTEKYESDMYEDPYYALFLSNNILRPSCYNCPSKGRERRADITLADFWGVEDEYPELVDGEGISLAIFHSEKGKEIFRNIECHIEGHEVEFEKAIKGNGAFFSAYAKPSTRDQFWKDFDKYNMERLKYKYCGGRKKKVKMILKRLGLLNGLRAIKHIIVK